MIWCVEDDTGIREIEMYALSAAGFEVKGFEDGLSCWNELKHDKPDLLLLDVMLPGMDGLEILKKMKENVDLGQIPVIMASAKGQEYDRIRGLNLGADDYLVKPFSMMEMVARVNAVLRRSVHHTSNLLQSEELVMNLEERTVTLNGKRIQLTFKEFELLRLFLSHPGRVYTREQLFAQVWQMEYFEDSRTLDSHIRSLRHKIEKYGNKIETVRNVGYRWEMENGK